MTRDELGEFFGVHARTVHRDITLLRALGFDVEERRRRHTDGSPTEYWLKVDPSGVAPWCPRCAE